MTVVIEGVETEEQWHWLTVHGAYYVQGYFFAKPAFPPPIPPTHAGSRNRRAARA